MPASRWTRGRLEGVHVDVFTCGRSSIYGYDSVNHCLVVYSSIAVRKETDLSVSTARYHLSSAPSVTIRRLILNDEETIVALVADKLLYFVSLGKSSAEISDGDRLCRIIRLTPLVSTRRRETNEVIDFLWLSAKTFAVVYSVPSACQCHVYRIESFEGESIELVKSFAVGSSELSEQRRKISVDQPSPIIRLTGVQRHSLTFLLAMKSNGDIFLLELDRTKLVSK